MDFLVLENYNLKKDLTDEEFIKAAKEHGYDLDVVTKITTLDGRVDAILYYKLGNTKSEVEFAQNFVGRKLRRFARRWDYYGMGKIYSKREIARVRELIHLYNN